MESQKQNDSADMLDLCDFICLNHEKIAVSNVRAKVQGIKQKEILPEILFISSFPPRECGIANYTQDLINSIDKKFNYSFTTTVCALETNEEKHRYHEKVTSTLNTDNVKGYIELSEKINDNENIKAVIIQHEFGFFRLNGGIAFINLIESIKKPVIIVFHTVLPAPDDNIRTMVRAMADACKCIVVMTKSSADSLKKNYKIDENKIEIIAHGTHLISNNDKTILKEKYGFADHRVLSTFGLLSSGKGIETTLKSMPEIIKTNPETLFLIIGKTHPGVLKTEGEKYREKISEMVAELNIGNHVKFINHYLDLPILLEYLRLTDIYLFTSKDPNQAVSGTFSYAMSCGCPVISTPIPQALEMLDEHTGIIIGFQDSESLTSGVKLLLSNEKLRKNISLNTLHKIAPTAWENSATLHALLFEKITGMNRSLIFSWPEINLDHIKRLTTNIGIIQFSKINQPDIKSGYTLDDNSRALIAMCMHFELTGDTADLYLINKYLLFISYCMMSGGRFLNYVDKDKKFTYHNGITNLEDSAGRAVWALGYIISSKSKLPSEIISMAETLLLRTFQHMETIYSARAMAFNIKGLYYYNKVKPSRSNLKIIEMQADRLAAMYQHESNGKWNWFESYLTYANSVLSESMLMAWDASKNPLYHTVANNSFEFLLEKTFIENEIKVIPNKSWLKKNGDRALFGEQPIEVSYTILALDSFCRLKGERKYIKKINGAFSWFLGNNHLKRIIYNPCTGGCYDGLEESHVNLNQGAESAVSYLMARMIVEKYKK